MKKGTELDSPLQTAHVYFLKGEFGVKRTTPAWAVLRVCGKEPLQFYRFCADAKFLMFYFAGIVACSRRFWLAHEDCGLFKKIVHADIALSASYKNCWTAKFI